MNKKALQAFAYMASRPDYIKDIVPSGSEYYFKFKGHNFSVNRHEIGGRTVYSGFVYPGSTETTKDLAEYYETGDFEERPLFRYGTDDPENYEFIEPLRALYALLADKAMDLDSIFNDVLDDDGH